MRLSRSALLGSLVLLAACAGDIPASLLLTVGNQDPAPAPERVRVRAYDGAGEAHAFVTMAVPAPGAGGRLGTVVVYPRRNRTGALRVEAQGMKGEAVISAGAVEVTLQDGKQTSAALLLNALGQADADSDGVPDEIDVCPFTPDLGQEDGDGDGVGDACRGQDGGAPDQGGDTGVDLGGTDKATGSPCSSASQCSSGFCADDVCCEAACTDGCRSCNLPGRAGQCAPMPAGERDPHGACTTESAASCGFDGRCNGAGGCRRHPAGTECRPPSCSGNSERVLPGTCDGNGDCAPSRTQSCAPYLCADAACKDTCGGPSDCAPGAVCNAGSCGRKPLGVTCGAASDCNSGNCVDGVCCDVATCTGPCRACNLPSSAGSCQSLAQGAAPRASGCPAQDANSCGRTGVCDGAGACELHPLGTSCGGRSCTGATEIAAPSCDGKGTCVAGMSRACGDYLCAAGACATTCNDDSACAPAAFCRPDNVCATRAANGANCTAGNACASGNCVDGRCCTSASCGSGQTCTGTGGTCVGQRALGVSCTSNVECGSGFCTDGVCCENACTTPCRRCDGAPAGRCQTIDFGRDSNATPSCSGGRRCDNGTCR